MYHDLRNKTFLDFTGNQNIIGQIIDIEDDENGIKEYPDGLDETVGAVDFLYFCELTGNDTLKKAVEHEFEPELLVYFIE
jgi:hypothetical protein